MGNREGSERQNRRFRALGCAIGLAIGVGIATTTDASAATYDPDLKWRTIVTEHFRIHFHQGEEALAEHFSHMVEEVYEEMTDELAWPARMRTEVVLIDRTDRANGFASAVPYNAITIFVTAPQEDSTLSLYEDWSTAIFVHELTHVLHMETNHGIVRAARAVVGRIASTNDVSPPWIIEGLATFQETRHTAGGRGRSPFVDMIKRAAVLEDDFPPLGNLDGFQADPPSGNLRYLFGQDFIQFVADQRGADTWTRWIHAYGSGIPYILPSRWVFRRRLNPLYRDWKRALQAEYGAQADEVRALGLREGRLISDGVASCSAPSYAPDDSRLIWSCIDRETGSAIWSSKPDGTEPEKLIQDFSAKTFTWRSDGKAFVYAATHIVNRFNTWSDIYMYDLEAKRPRSLTSGARARDPDFSPDGSRLVMVTNRAQNNQLEVLTVDRRRQKLTNIDDHTQFSTPRYSPDGKVLAVSVWDQGRRDLWLYGTDGTPLRRLTADLANDRDPSWSKDGRWLYFSSDRTGIPNIYALDLMDERIWQVTNVLTGASRPSVRPDGTMLAYEQWSQDGWDVRVMDLDPTQWIDRGRIAPDLARPGELAALTTPITDAPVATDAISSWESDPIPRRRRGGAPAIPELAAQDPGEAIDTFGQAQVDDVFGDEEDYPFTIPPKRYNPWSGLVPRYWVPGFQTTPYFDNNVRQAAGAVRRRFNLGGLIATARTGTSDPLRRYAYSANLTYRSDANFVGGGASFTVNRFLPIYSMGTSVSAQPRFYNLLDADASAEAGEDVARTDARGFYFERRLSASAQLSYPFTPKWTFFTNYIFSWRTAMQSIAADAISDSIPLRGTLGTLSVGWRYSWGQPTVRAISREDARTVSLVASVAAPWLGSISQNDDGTSDGVQQIRAVAEIREYVVNPAVPNHVFALRAAAGVSVLSSDFLGNYQLGGNFGESAFYVTTPGFRMVRGYQIGADLGDNFWLAAAEYRLPLWRMDRGFGTLPLYLRVLHAAFFVDAGNAFNTVNSFVDVFDDALVGVGAELRLSTVLGWSSGITGRFGWATGLTQRGTLGAIGPRDPQSFYVQFGGSF